MILVEFASRVPVTKRVGDSIAITQSSIARYAGYEIGKFLSLWGGASPRGGAPGATGDWGLSRWNIAQVVAPRPLNLGVRRQRCQCDARRW